MAGNAEDEVGERIAAVRETELLYGPESLLALFGPMIVHICGSPHKFKVIRVHSFSIWLHTIHPRTSFCGRPPHSHLVNSSALVHNSATSTIVCYSKYWKRRMIPIFEAT